MISQAKWPSGRLRHCWVLAVMWLFWARGATCAQPHDEYAVKAVYLYQFARYVTWPDATSGQVFTICILGENPFGDYLKELEGKKVATETVAVRQLASLDDYEPCRILFVAGKDARALQLLGQARRRLEGEPVLVVAEAEGAAAGGAVIGFIQVGSNIRFEVNRQAASAAHLAVSAKLLRLAARDVGQNPGR